MQPSVAFAELNSVPDLVLKMVQASVQSSMQASEQSSV
jgi:hypothetical protein